MASVKQDKILFSQADFPLLCSQSSPNATPVSLWHETLAFKYILTGSITMMIDTETVTANTGDMILINPYEVHSNLLERVLQ